MSTFSRIGLGQPCIPASPIPWPAAPCQHKAGTGSAFTSRYKLTNLVYYEEFADVVEAIAREKQIKAGSRRRKLDLINAFNPGWLDLFDDIVV